MKDFFYLIVSMFLLIMMPMVLIKPFIYKEWNRQFIEQANNNHAEILTELKNSNQIELELIDAVNLMNNKRHIQSPDVNCEAIATFLDSLEKAKHNRIKKGDLLK